MVHRPHQEVAGRKHATESPLRFANCHQNARCMVISTIIAFAELELTVVIGAATPSGIIERMPSSLQQVAEPHTVPPELANIDTRLPHLTRQFLPQRRSIV
eukprot:CAMPEP_0198603106 /NCGR_PEP_ID=MMETSP1462-20131121/151556_1 /TAXON_ID=1333877 /ORGANISM="Brandtodinium nutriculum, Strain RCC3387" /LENGTH=100 /DNA_ID=CAMNT_0044334875 /DNA_START=34 /DNA_END=336 /DNA_ORIENTATION=-